MSTPDVIGRHQGRGPHEEEQALTEGRRVYAGSNLPAGSVPVAERTLARVVQPGAIAAPHGVPPIGVIGLPAGWVIQELFTDDTAELRVLPFRFPFYSRAYALRCGERLCAVVRNVQPMELLSGNQVVIQYNDSKDWSAVFGRIVKVDISSLRLRTPDGEETVIEHEKTHFVGKVMAWWDDSAEAAATAELD